LAVVASRSSLVAALLRTPVPSDRHSVLNFLRGLSRNELECLADFNGAWLIESEYSQNVNPYRLMADFFDPAVSESWQNPDVRSHRTFVVLAWLDQLHCRKGLRVQQADRTDDSLTNAAA